jgi:type II secretory pathway predicted ATPase ExeA
MVLRPDLTQFAQRVASSFHLTTMDEPTVCSYIGHRLAVAGSERVIFSPLSIREVFRATRGVPRLVNQLCDLALVYGYAKQHRYVLLKTVRQVLDDGVFFAGGMAAKATLRLSDADKVE